jgi:hypothetical protein
MNGLLEKLSCRLHRGCAELGPAPAPLAMMHPSRHRRRHHASLGAGDVLGDLDAKTQSRNYMGMAFLWYLRRGRNVDCLSMVQHGIMQQMG